MKEKEKEKYLLADEKVQLIKEMIEKYGEGAVKKMVTRTKEAETLFYKKTELRKYLKKYINEFSDEELEVLGCPKEVLFESVQEKLFENKEVEEEAECITGEIPKITNENNTEVLQANTNGAITKELQQITVVNEISELMKNVEIVSKFKYFLENIDKILNIQEQSEGRIIVPKDILKMKSVVKSVRVSEEIMQEFDELCDDNRNYSKINLLNLALREFIDKYKKS